MATKMEDIWGKRKFRCDEFLLDFSQCVTVPMYLLVLELHVLFYLIPSRNPSFMSLFSRVDDGDDDFIKIP